MAEMIIRCAHSAMVPIADLKKKFNPKNRNKHPQAQLDRLSRILAYQGARYCAKISNQSGWITSGHGRILAAEIAGWTEYPVDFQDYENPEQEYADLQADNAIALWAELDLAGVNLDLAELGPDFDIDHLGLENFTLDPPITADSETEYGHFSQEYSQTDGIKQIIMAFEKTEYEAMIPSIKEAIRKSGAPTVKDLFVRLVQSYVEIAE